MFTNTKTRAAVINQHPSAVALVKVDGGYTVFFSTSDIKIYERSIGRALPKTAYVDYKRPAKAVPAPAPAPAPAPEEAKQQELPTLTGSEKQVAWATSIRQSKIDGIKKMLETLENAPKDAPLAANYAKGIAAVKALIAETSSQFWIETRNNEFGTAWLVHQIKKA